MKKPFYSIGIIFKNEIRCLERCLASLEPLRKAVPCEVVMADTGSTDGSREVAEKYADILFDFPWIDDFAAARNAVIDRCSGVWYMGIDADEWFNGDTAELVLFSKHEKLAQDIVGFTIRNCKSELREASDYYMDFTALRMMRLSSGLRYEGCIHEKFNREAPKASMLGNTLFYHDGYYYGTRAQQEEKRQRNLGLLEKKLKNDPDDLQTISEYIDAAKGADSDVVSVETIMECTKHSLEVLHGNWERWGYCAATAYRNAVSVAKLHNQPELLEWAEKAVELFPDSMYIRIDVAYYACARCWDEKRVEDAIRWGEMYLAGLEDYRADRFNPEELMRGVLENASPYWERKLRVVLAQAKLELNEPEKTREILAGLDGGTMDEKEQVEACVNIMMRLHRITKLDIQSLAVRFWEQINCPTPDEKMAEERRKAFLKTASHSFELSYIASELKKEDFLRHSYTMFLTLEKDHQLRVFATMLEETDPAVLTKKMTLWEGAPMPVSVLFHALELGVPFPLPGKPQKIESMDVLAKELAKEPERLCRLVLGGIPAGNIQQLCWGQVLALAAVQSCKWTDEEQSMDLCRTFAEAEKAFLSEYYMQLLLCDENVHLLPPVHRFGWYLVQAFERLNEDDRTAYVRFLRKALEIYPDMRPMVEFLLKQLEEVRKSQTSSELMALAEQVRTLLAAYPADDPAVLVLKQSDAYRKVAHLIEG